jgi:hypothetical protein
MKIKRTEQDVAGVVSLIRNAREFVVIVSPFSELTGWDELKNTINDRSREITIEFYVRQGQGRNGIEGIQADLFEVPLLHAKMIFSEHEGMISSGNLHSRPDINCTFLLDNKEEYRSVVGFFETYIKPAAVRIN